MPCRGALAACALWASMQAAALGAAGGAAGDDDLAQLVERSRQLGLATQPQWIKLLHYVPDLLSPGVHSLAETARFFNARAGRHDPRAELEATLAAFFNRRGQDDGSAQCVFPARFAWLDEQLRFDPVRLPRRRCARYQRWHDELDASALTLIFAAAYLNNPSSMYGHTFLRVDARDQDERTRLLAAAINFAANTRETNGIAFAVNGLFGGYPGSFSMKPYYAKVREYGELENRDLWEYQLNLSQREVDVVLMHAWELDGIEFRYYFLDANCSYQLLALLQVARPDLDLTGGFRWWAIPTDTVRAVTGTPGLVRSVVYRPSDATMIGHRLRAMSAAERRAALDLSLGRSAPADAERGAADDRRAAAIVETAQAYLDYRREAGAAGVADPAGLDHELLAARSRLPAGPTLPSDPAPPVRPDEGHGSARVLLGAGRWEGQKFEQIEARPAYHDILDADGGFVPGAQIGFLDVDLRHYFDRNGGATGPTRLERFVPLDIVSLAPRDDFFRPVSWHLEAGWQRLRLSDGSQPLALGAGGGAGLSWADERRVVLGYAMLDATARLAGGLQDGYEAGGGARLGVLVDPVPRWRLHAYVRWTDYALGQRDTPWQVGLQQRIALSRDLAVRLDVDRERQFGRGFDNASASILFYF